MSAATAVGKAHDALAALEDRVRDGDATVTAADLAAAREGVRFVELQLDGKQRAAEKQAAEERQAQIRQIITDATALLTSEERAAVREAYASMVEAIAAFTAASTVYQTKVVDVIGRAQRADLNTGAMRIAGNELVFDDGETIKLWPVEGYITAATIEAKGEVKTSLELAHDGVHEMHTLEAAQALRDKYSPWSLGEGGASGAQQRHQKQLQLERQRHREEMDRPRGVVTTGNMPRTERLDRPKVRRY